MRTLLFLLSVVLPTSALAQADFIELILADYEGFGNQAHAALFPYAIKLFWLLAVIEFTLGALNQYMDDDGFQEFGGFVFKMILKIGFFWWILLNSYDLMWIIIESFEMAGAIAGNLPQDSLRPDTILQLGLEAAAIITGALGGVWGAITNPGTAIMAALGAVGILVAFTLIAGHLTITLIEASLVMSASVLLVAFSILRFSRDFLAKVISYAFSVGIRLFFLYLVLGVGIKQSIKWVERLEQMKDNDEISGSIVLMFSILGGSIVLALIAWSVPRVAAAYLSGGMVLSASDLVSAVRRGVNQGMNAGGGVTGAIRAVADAIGSSGSGGSDGDSDKTPLDRATQIPAAASASASGTGAAGGAETSASGGKGVSGSAMGAMALSPAGASSGEGSGDADDDTPPLLDQGADGSLVEVDQALDQAEAAAAANPAGPASSLNAGSSHSTLSAATSMQPDADGGDDDSDDETGRTTPLSGRSSVQSATTSSAQSLPAPGAASGQTNSQPAVGGGGSSGAASTGADLTDAGVDPAQATGQPERSDSGSDLDGDDETATPTAPTRPARKKRRGTRAARTLPVIPDRGGSAETSSFHIPKD